MGRVPGSADQGGERLHGQPGVPGPDSQNPENSSLPAYICDRPSGRSDRQGMRPLYDVAPEEGPKDRVLQ